MKKTVTMVSLFALVLTFMNSSAIPIAQKVEAATNPITMENAKPGANDWKLANPGYASGVIEGYASATSVNRGGQINLYVNTAEPNYKMDIFRVGYYGGAGARRMLPTISLTGTAQATCPMDATTGMVECKWTNPYTLSIPNSADPTDWMSGYYLVKLTAGTSGKQQYIIFVVRDDARVTDLLMQQSVSTYQAYNIWGGKSLYGTIANPGDTANKANKVSFDRPYYADNSEGQGQFFSDNYTGWEFDMVQFLEKEGYDVSYATSVDVDADANLLLSHKAFLSVGHDEYWSWKMRDNVEHARDAGINIGFFSGNTSYWQIRFESGISNPTPGRVEVGYKENWQQDPITPTQYKTTRWRDNPVNRSEDSMMGTRFITQAKPPFIVEDASNWVFTGTGLKNGDVLTKPDGNSFLGYEVDSMGPFSPANVQRLAHSPATPAYANFSDMTVYMAASGATVFDTGSIGWSSSVPQIQQITRNVLARFINKAFADTTPVRPSLPSPFALQDIGDVGRPGFVSLADTSSFTLNGAGTDSPFAGQDALLYAYQQLNGDGQIVTQLKSLQNFWDNRAGVMIRETLAPGSKSVSLLSRPSESYGTINEGAELRVKDIVGGKLNKVGSADLKLPNWLKLVRVGNTFTSYISADGNTWTQVGSASVPMDSNVYIGAMVTSAQHGVWATAVFDNVKILGGSSTTPPPPTPTPTPTPTPPPTTLPTGWSNQDIGSVGPAGNTAYNTNTSTFSVTGAGADIWNNADALQYAYTTLNGDGRIVARVNSVQNIAAWTKAGVMIRESLNADSAHGLMLVSSGKGLAFQRRVATANISTSTGGGLLSAPRWVRLDRIGNTLTAYQSADGNAWTLVGSDTFNLPAKVYIGLAVTSHTTASTATATFDNVTVTAATTPTPTPPPPAPTPTPPPPTPTPTPPPPAPSPQPPPTGCAVMLDKTSFYAGAGTPGTAAATWYINATASCTYTASSDSSWLELKNPATASYSTAALTFTGNAAIRVHALGNPGPKRTGHFTIGTVVYTVTQDPAPGF